MAKSPFEDPFSEPDKEIKQGSEKPKNAREVAMENWQRHGRLGVTAQDHIAIGGSPPLEMNKQWGKTQAETMTDVQLLEYLKKLEVFLASGRERYEKDERDDWAREDIRSAKKDLRKGLEYLRSINRLPKEFEDFVIEDLPDDPKER